MRKIEKTNVMRILDAKKIDYGTYAYPHAEGEAVDGISVAELIGKDPASVFKTLVAKSGTEHFVFMIPVADTLDLKKAAAAVLKKSIEMVRVDEINPLTGYVRGGCSPIGMKTRFPTVIEEKALRQEKIIFSAGKIGFQVEMKPTELAALIDAKIAPLIYDNHEK